MIFTASLLVMHLVLAFKGAAAFDYTNGPEGPANWFKTYPECNGERQSPLDISPGKTVYDPFLQDFAFHGWKESRGIQMKLKNVGKSVVIEFDGDMWIEGGGLIGRYKTAQLHFHWGSQNSYGSEHTFDGKSYPMELHIVHYAERYGNLSNAIDNVDGLAVLGFFFEIQLNDNPYYTSLLENFNSVLFKGQEKILTPFALKSLINHNWKEFYRYDGSLTTPGCQESVLWTVFREAVPLSQSQLGLFRQLHSNKQAYDAEHEVKNDFMSDNFRPIQPSHGRVIYSSVPTDSNKNKWHYGSGELGPSHWSSLYKICTGIRQSPININTTIVQYDRKLTDFKFHGYDKHDQISLKLQNNGHGVQIDVEGDLSIEGADLDGAYKLKEFHFHWGSDNLRGSEHTVNEHRYPMEMHAIHYNPKYGSFPYAMKEYDGLAVLAVFFEISEENNTNYDPLISHMQDIRFKDKHQPLDAFPLRNILPVDMSKYYRYLGSLTTPGCYESVLWTLFVETVKISQEQLNAFRELYDVNEGFTQTTDNPLLTNNLPNDVQPAVTNDVVGETLNTDRVQEVTMHNIVNNFRPVQKLNHRIVYSSFDSYQQTNESEKTPNEEDLKQILSNKSWHYDNKEGGPLYWQKKYPLCSGVRQSPINVVSKKAKHNEHLSDFTFHKWRKDSKTKMYVENKGYTVQLNIEGNSAIEEAGLDGRYKTAQLHFHWGSENWMGSEHTIDGEAYPLELHIVHYAEKYENLSNAVTKPDGLAVLGFMYELSENDNPRYRALLQHMEDIKFKGKKKYIKPFSLTDLLPETVKYYYRYLGSLTTPGCQESVIWTLFHDTIKISESQLEQFRSLHMLKQEEFDFVFPNAKRISNKRRLSLDVNKSTDQQSKDALHTTSETEPTVPGAEAEPTGYTHSPKMVTGSIRNAPSSNISENSLPGDILSEYVTNNMENRETEIRTNQNNTLESIHLTTVKDSETTTRANVETINRESYHINIDTRIVNNYRPVQHLYGRVVHTNKPEKLASHHSEKGLLCGTTVINAHLFLIVFATVFAAHVKNILL